MQKIATDKVNIIKYDPESTSVTSNFFPKSNSVHYYTLAMELCEKSVVCQGVHENIVILNVTIFCVQTKAFGNIKFCCLIITPFVS